VRLTDDARAVVHHASGAMLLRSGLEPMDRPFDDVRDRETLQSMVDEQAKRFDINRWSGDHAELRDERLWQIKAAAADRNGRSVDPVLFRIVGTFRHVVRDLPVWGPASVAIKLAGGGALDSLAVQVREPSGEVIDEVGVLPAEEAAASIARQLVALMGRSQVSIDDVARPRWMRFGYMSMSKRKPQRLLEPVYVAQIDIDGEDAQGYLLVAPAGERVYMPFDRHGADAVDGAKMRVDVC
jgi:hypothetical protein